MGRRIGRWQLKVRGRQLLTQVGRFAPGSDGSRVVVLCYHSVHPTSPISSASPELFDDHLAWLSSECECIPFSQIPTRIGSPVRGRPAVAVTFDDGFADNHETALPLLAKWGVPATFFVTAGFVERDQEVLARFRVLLGGWDERFEPLAWPQVLEMRDAGMEIGAHTYRHPNLALLSPRSIREELGRSMRLLEDRIGAPVTTMAYPFGKPRRHVTPEVVSAAQDLGIRLAASVLHRDVRRRDSPLQIPRFMMLRDSTDMLKAKVHGVFDVVGLGQERGPLWAARLITPTDFRFDT